MSLRKLPDARTEFDIKALDFDPPADILERWASGPVYAEAKDGEQTITVYDVIGQSWDGAGVTPKRIDAALRSIGNADVTVKINSPGGNVFDGLAIYNMLAQHRAKVTVQVMGVAASAASIIAMAGDRIEVAQGGFLMLHNAWGVVIGNRHDLRKSADTLDQIDASMADIYQSRSGMKSADVTKLMDEETWIGAKDAVAKGLADASVVVDGEAKAEGKSFTAIAAKRRIDAALAKTGMPRVERRELLRELQAGTHDASGTVTPRADVIDHAALLRLIETMRS